MNPAHSLGQRRSYNHLHGHAHSHLHLKPLTTDATNSNNDPSESLVSNNNGTFRRVFHQFRSTLKNGLLRKTVAPLDSHNTDNVQPEGTKPSIADKYDKKTKVSAVAAAMAARKLAESSYTVDTDLYDLKTVLSDFDQIGNRILPKNMKFMMVLRRQQTHTPQDPSRNHPGNRGDVMKPGGAGGAADGAQVCLHPLFDKIAKEFCLRVGMSEVTKMPQCEERIFLWMSRERAQRQLTEMTTRQTGDQIFFINRVNLDHVLTDLHCLCTRLDGCVARDGQVYPAHCCPDPAKVRELSKNVVENRYPRFVFLDRQTMCHHVYLKQDFGVACEVKGCPNFGKRICSCFQRDLFIPDTIILSTKRKFETFRSNLIKKTFDDQRWLIRSSNNKNGNGVQIIDQAPELETLWRYDLKKKLTGQFFVLQRCTRYPLLLENKRFDLRMFLLVVVLTDRRVLGFLHPGYVRMAQLDFQADSNDLRCHLTCPLTWDPDYNRYKPGTGTDAAAGTGGESEQQQPPAAADYCRPYAEVSAELGLPKIACHRSLDTLLRTISQGGSDGPAEEEEGGAVPNPSSKRLLKRIGRIVHYLVSQIDSIICDKPGSWQLFGVDLQVDSDMDIWLYDVMTYPGQDEPDTRSATQNKVIPAVLTESLALVLELNQRDFMTRNKKLWMDLPDVPVNQPGLITAQRHFVWLYSTEVDRLVTFKTQRQRTKPLHWYQQWKITEDFNDYILYLKNFRIDQFPLDEDKTVYGRRSFPHSKAERLRKTLRKGAKSTEKYKTVSSQDADPAADTV